MRRLILRPGAIGDCLLALPALEHLRADYTELWISRPLVPLISFADRVQPLSVTGIDMVGIPDREIPEHLSSKLRSFDSIVSWYGTARSEFREALEALGVTCTFLHALPPPGMRQHATAFFCEQVGALDGTPTLHIEPLRPSPDIVIHPFSGSTRKNWTLEKYRALARRIAGHVDWTAGPEEHLPDAKRFDDLSALAKWLAGARLYIGNDSGITHLAAALGIPIIALFGPTDPQVWAPRGKNVTILRREPLSDLRVDEVLAAVNQAVG